MYLIVSSGAAPHAGGTQDAARLAARGDLHSIGSFLRCTFDIQFAGLRNSLRRGACVRGEFAFLYGPLCWRPIGFVSGLNLILIGPVPKWIAALVSRTYKILWGVWTKKPHDANRRVLITNERAIRMICVVGMQKAHLTCGIYPQLSQVIYRRCVTDSPFIVAKEYKKTIP
jgi:hypothetical protein